MICTKQREVIEELDDIVDAKYELTHIELLGFKQEPIEVPLQVLKLLHREEFGLQTLNNNFVVRHGFVSILPNFLFENS